MDMDNTQPYKLERDNILFRVFKILSVGIALIGRLAVKLKFVSHDR